MTWTQAAERWEFLFAEVLEVVGPGMPNREIGRPGEAREAHYLPLGSPREIHEPAVLASSGVGGFFEFFQGEVLSHFSQSFSRT